MAIVLVAMGTGRTLLFRFAAIATRSNEVVNNYNQTHIP